MKNIETKKFIAIDSEFETAYSLLEKGLSEINNISDENDFYHLPLSLLAQGIERILKLILIFLYLSKNNVFPTTKEIKTHDLKKLQSDVFDFKKYNNSYLRKLIDDVKSDKTYCEILKTLSIFGDFGRYHNFNVIIGNKKLINPKELWENLENKIIQQDKDLQKIQNDMLKKPELCAVLFQKLTKKIITHIKAAIKTYSLIFTLGDIGNEPKKFIFRYLKYF